MEIHIYAVGLVYASACAPASASVAEIETEANARHPTGTSPWRKSDSETFASGEPNPCACDRDPGQRHWLLSC